jgi:hypothetical protein
MSIRPTGKSLHDQLKGIRRDVPKAPRNKLNIHALGKDGVDHINIYYEAETDLGQLLDPGSRLALTHSQFGVFSNIDSFWKYIQSDSKDDVVRKMYGLELKLYAKKHLNMVSVPNLKAIIADAMYQRIMNKRNQLLATALKESELPFTRYFVNNSLIRVNYDSATWFVAAIEEIRAALKENRSPDFDFLKDNPKIGIYDGVVAQMSIAPSQSKKTKNELLDRILANRPKSIPKSLDSLENEESNTTEGEENAVAEEPVVDVSAPLENEGDDPDEPRYEETELQSETEPEVNETPYESVQESKETT